MGILDFFIEKNDKNKKPDIDPTKPLKGQLNDNQPMDQPIVRTDQSSEVYKKTAENIQNFFNGLDGGKGSYHSFLRQVEFLKDAIPDRQLLFSKAFQILQNEGGDKYKLQQSAVMILEQLKLQQTKFNEAIEKKKEETERQTLTDIEFKKKRIIDLEREINETKQQLQELTSNIAVSKSDFTERGSAYNEISVAVQNEINSNLKEIQKFIN